MFTQYTFLWADSFIALNLKPEKLENCGPRKLCKYLTVFPFFFSYRSFIARQCEDLTTMFGMAEYRISVLVNPHHSIKSIN